MEAILVEAIRIVADQCHDNDVAIINLVKVLTERVIELEAKVLVLAELMVKKES